MATQQSTALDAYDTLNRKLTQARAVLASLEAAGEEHHSDLVKGLCEEQQGFDCGHKHAMALIWNLRDLLGDAAQAARNCRT